MEGSASLMQGLRVQRRVIGALLLRETLTRYGRHNIGFLWLFLEPMIFTLGVTALWTFVGMHRQSSIPIVAWAVTGYSSILLWRNMPSRCVKAVEPNLALMYHRNVKIVDVYAARLILEAAGATLSFALLACLFIGAGMMGPPEDVVKVMVAWVLLTWFGFALAMVIGSLTEQSEVVEKLWHPVTYLLFPLSGAVFNVDALPEAGQQIILLLPMVHGVEMLREGYFGSVIHAHYSVTYLTLVCAVLSLVGLANLRSVGREISPG
jgi:ABC-2 type transport system permease protein/capsular polysaccharide transport system permease protein